jgi:oligopeptide/dipeptide ABC transporter ATP-binding protein
MHAGKERQLMQADDQDLPLLKVHNLRVEFATKSSIFSRQKSSVKAVDGISFDIKRGETLGLVGESGSGKTTAALAIARLLDASGGEVKLNDIDLFQLENEDLRQARTKLQFIFQDPYSSLNPRKRAEEIVREPLDSLTDFDMAERQQIVDNLFRSVGLRHEQKKLFPHQFSGGQRQRLGIARALSTNPEFVICDEAVSALDVAVQAQILNLLKDLQVNLGLTYLFISHDLGVVKHMCDSVVVMYMGKVVEHANREQLFAAPKHPYTKTLLNAVPKLDVTLDVTEVQNQMSKSTTENSSVNGCKFFHRCPLSQPKCKEIVPELGETQTGHWVACHMIS